MSLFSPSDKAVPELASVEEDHTMGPVKKIYAKALFLN
jgi:hypothetical protein